MNLRGNALLQQEEASGYRLRWVGVVATLLMTLLHAEAARAESFTVTMIKRILESH